MSRIFTKCKAVIAEQSFVRKNQALTANVTVVAKTNGVQCQTWKSVLTATPNALYRSLKAVPGVHSVRVEIVPEV